MAASDRMALRTRDVTVPVVATVAHAVVNVPATVVLAVLLHGVPTLVKLNPWLREPCFVFCVVYPPHPYFCARQSPSP